MTESEYLEKEAEYTRAAVLTLIDKIEELERYALITTGAIWSWAAANNQSSAIHYLLWSPFFINSLFAFRAYVKWRHLKLHMEYLANLESKLDLKISIGIGNTTLKKWGKLAEKTGSSFWIILVLVNFFVSLFAPSLITS
ncbi:hypothetical protein [Acaryochloris marina]|uniref:Uncharacterized protein n=1 Tax=Acaryochloris marina (strain MBIC 11017) TaxID=329726 RepID=A8ZPA6_ACAM1|nr:hypothetical protein [Acaryochloris marina]ABW32842.1 hypothetical protein AM1_E0072 [Acaryochloris marina MBIC11017]